MIKYEYKAKIARVVDGDTVDLDVDLGFRVCHQVRCRLARIDAPEVSTDAGKDAKARLIEYLPVGAECVLRTSKGDRYGRWIAELEFCDGLVSDWLLGNGLAKAYTGRQ